MDDLISRQAAIEAMESYSKFLWGRYHETFNLGAVASMLSDLPSAQRTGRWIWDDEGYHCSECFYHAYGNTSEVMMGDFKFCPNCGCAMEGEDE